jgi:putative colanic acid biosynthesis acetyltransferase WcaF
MQKTNLSAYSNYPYHPGGSVLKRVLWYYVNALLFKSSWLPVSNFKVAVLRMFGAKIGKGVVIKPC